MTTTDIREALSWRERSARKVLTGGRIPSKREQALRARVDRAREQYEEWPDHTSEIGLALAERDLREYLEGRAP